MNVKIFKVSLPAWSLGFPNSERIASSSRAKSRAGYDEGRRHLGDALGLQLVEQLLPDSYGLSLMA